MISGIGLDLIELDRIETMLERQPKIASRVLTPRELEQFHPLIGKRRVEFLAGRFAAKEAYSKALGTGIGASLSFQEIELIKNESGKPFLKVDRPGRVHVSITHSETYAAAQVVIEEE